MLLGTYIVFPPVSVLGMAVFTQAFLRHTGIVTGADGLPIALVSWALVWLLVWRGISLTARSVIAVEAVSLLIAALIVVIFVRPGTGNAPGRQTLTPDVFKLPRGTGLAAAGFACTYGILSYGGFESSISAGEESCRPTEVIPRSIVAAVASRTLHWLATGILATVSHQTGTPAGALTASMTLTFAPLLRSDWPAPVHRGCTCSAVINGDSRPRYCPSAERSRRSTCSFAI